MFDRLKAMLVKEFIQVLRDPRMRIVTFVIPVVQVIIFGYAVNTDVRHVATAVYDLDNSAESRDVVDRFVRSGYFDLAERVNSDSRVRELMDRGEVKAVLKMDRGFGEKLRGGRTAPLQMILDGSDSNTAGIVLNYAAGIVSRLSDEQMRQTALRRGGTLPRVGGIELQSRAWFNENLESRNFYLPAVIANLVLVITMILSSMAVVREKEIGTIEQIIVTPIRRGEFILGKTIPFVIIGFINVALVTLVSTAWFGIPVRGSLSLLFGATTLFLMSTLGIGLLISTISRTQQQAMMSAFFVIFPAMLLSGFAFPIENMPEPVQWLTFLNPLRYYIVILRGVFLKGVGLPVLAGQMGALLLLGAAILGYAIRRFHKTL